MKFLYSVLVCATVAFVSIGQASAVDEIIIQSMEADLYVEYDDRGNPVTVSLLVNH